jgi:large subunit ribosomal protein L23
VKTPFDIVKTVRITEKGTALSEKNNQYLLKVNPRANKHQIRNAVERLFNVKVTGVRTLNVAGKGRRKRTKQEGATSDWKKAIVTLKQGDKIEVTA